MTRFCFITLKFETCVMDPKDTVDKYNEVMPPVNFYLKLAGNNLTNDQQVIDTIRSLS